MSVDIRAPVSVIEGIGPVASAALARVGVLTVLDLLRMRFGVIAAAVRTIASADQVRSWRRMATLLQVAAVTPQWAEALVRGKIETVAELSRKSLDDIEALMRQAKAHGTIPAIPAAAQIAEFLKDAAILCYTGVVAGTVLGPDRSPVPGAIITVGPAQSESDERGHFRVFRVPFARVVPLEITHPSFQALVIEQPRVARDMGVVGGQTFRMQPIGAESPVPMTLSDLHGDVLPSTYRTTRHGAPAPEALRDGDLLVVRELSSSDRDVQLVSRLKSYCNGELSVYTVRVPQSELPADVRVKDQFRVVSGRLIQVEMSPAQLHGYKLRLRLRKAFAGRPRPVSDDEKRALARDVFGFLVEQGRYPGGRGGHHGL